MFIASKWTSVSHSFAALLLATVAAAPVASLAHAGTVNIMIQRDDFDRNATAQDDFNADWLVEKNAGATITTGDPHASLMLMTVPDGAGAGAAVVWSKYRYKANQNLIFTTRLLGAYVEASAVYGDHQPRGLVAGKKRDNAIEFVTAYPAPQSVACRTVSNGAVTETIVNIGHSTYEPTTYQILTSATQVQFYIDGKRVAVHTTNIPTVALNPYYSTSDSGLGNVPLVVDWMTFERAVAGP